MRLEEPRPNLRISEKGASGISPAGQARPRVQSAKLRVECRQARLHGTPWVPYPKAWGHQGISRGVAVSAISTALSIASLRNASKSQAAENIAATTENTSEGEENSSPLAFFFSETERDAAPNRKGAPAGEPLIQSALP